MLVLTFATVLLNYVQVKCILSFIKKKKNNKNINKTTDHDARFTDLQMNSDMWF